MDEEDFYFNGPRDYNEQTDAFRFELDDLVERYLQEFDINTFVMIGAFQEKIQELITRNAIMSSAILKIVIFRNSPGRYLPKNNTSNYCCLCLGEAQR